MNTKIKSTKALATLMILLGVISVSASVVSAGRTDYFNFARPATPPTPVEPGNHIPRVITRKLRKGRVNRHYKAIIIGIDKDRNDKLTLKIDNLPKGLNVRSCSSFGRFKNKIRCIVTGTPTNSGRYQIVATISDGLSSSTKTLPLVIRGAKGEPAF